MADGEFSKLTWLKRTDGHKFTGAEFRVLVAIFNHSGADGTNAHPGLQLLSEETGYRKSGVSEALSSLKAQGWIREVKRGSGFSRKASTFELVPDAPQPPHSSAVAETCDSHSSAGANHIVPLERNHMFPLERKPSDPDIRSGSDPSRSDPKEVRYSANHLSDHEDSSDGCPLAAEGSEPTEEPEGFRPSGLVTLQSSTANGSHFDDPFCEESQKQQAKLAAVNAAREERIFQHSTAGSPEAPVWN